MAGAAAVLFLTLAASVAPAAAKVFMTQDEALKLAFPAGAAVKRVTAYLTEDQASAVEKECGLAVSSRIVVSYTDGEAAAYFDTHMVRTLEETIMILVTKEGAIGRIDVLSFKEPQEYLPKERWMDQMKGRKLDAELSLKRGIRPISGATLSARAIVEAARRVLAFHRVLRGPGAAAADPRPPRAPEGRP